MANITDMQKDSIRCRVLKAVDDVKITDIHTHIYNQSFGDILLWGIDELITYHYLVAETMRWGVVSPEDYWQMSKKEQADLIWKTLFIDHMPFSEACRGVLTVLDKLGLDTSARDLNEYRKYFESQSIDKYIDTVFETAGVESVVMTNDPFDDFERPSWLNDAPRDERFHAALRIDPILINWASASSKINDWGYDVTPELTEKTCLEICRFLGDWVDKMNALYLAVSLTPDFRFPDDSEQTLIIEKCILPVCREKGIPFALMIGVKRLINPRLKLAGDGVGAGDVTSVEYLCSNYPDNKFMVTMLSRENQHELTVAARKFSNLFLFGCWWFLNNPCFIEEMTSMRFDLLGPNVVPQHSDARVLDQLIYKWWHSRDIIGEVLSEKIINMCATGWIPTDEEIKRDVQALFGGNFWNYLSRG